MAAFSLLLIMGTMWGLQFAMLKMASESSYAEPLILMVALLALSVIYAAMSYPTRKAVPWRWSVVRFLGVAGVLGYVIPIMTMLYAAPALPAGLIAMFASISPVVAVLLAALFRTERITSTRVAAIILGIVSISIVLVPELELPDQGNMGWMLVALIVPVAFGVESVFLAARWPRDLSPLHAVTGETFLAALFVLPVILLSGTPIPTSIGWGDAEIAILVFVGAGVVESLIYFYLIKQTGAVFVNFGTFVSLFTGIGWGMVLFGENHAMSVWIAVLVLVGALFMASRDRHAG